MTGNPLELFRKSFGAVRANFWLCGSFLVPEQKAMRKEGNDQCALPKALPVAVSSSQAKCSKDEAGRRQGRLTSNPHGRPSGFGGGGIWT